ncbi:MAG: FdtA/QdtA family cupin domain-containing protein [Opitutales bacterium]|nr:FdtA/QdtA family cupin domain-containing protein [Opitutales bacterium]
MSTSINKSWKILDLCVHGDERGKLVAIEGGINCPFEVKRAFYVYDTKDPQEKRGCHANKKSEFLFVALSGSCKVIADDGNAREEFVLDNPQTALWLNKMTWKIMTDFSDNAVLLVLSNEKYDAGEYIRDYDVFLKEVQK